MLIKSLQSFARAYPDLKNTPFKSSHDTKIITRKLPDMLYEVLNLNRDTYKIKGSFGNGNWADVPWVCILHRGVTESTQNGYYVSILFSSDMKYLYVSIGFGWTQFEEKYGNKAGKEKIKTFCQIIEKYLPISDREIRGVINLNASTYTSKGYEYSNIASIRLNIESLATNDFIGALGIMLSHYHLLRDKFGADIFYDSVDDQLPSQTEDVDFKNTVKKLSSAVNKAEALKNLVSMAELAPPARKKRLSSHIIRNRSFADYVKERANYVCEVCGKKPFLKSNGKPYAEADHIERLDGIGKDHPDNMRCLCAQCHRVITYGSAREIESLSLR